MTTAPGTPARRPRWWSRATSTAMLWLLMLPGIAGLAIFTWYPNLETVAMSLYTWNGGESREYCGLANFRHALHYDPLFWNGFALIGVLFAANLVKMWPAIFTAIALHRLRSERAQFIYRVVLVIPMVIPAMVTLLIWKGFFDPTVGILNQALRATGLMQVLDGADTLLPAIAGVLEAPASPVTWLVGPVFGTTYGLLLAGALVLLCRHTPSRHHALLWITLWAVGLLAWHRPTSTLAETVLRGIALTAGCVVGTARLRRADPQCSSDRIARYGGLLIAGGALLVLATRMWNVHTGAFAVGQPSWLGNSHLVLPAVVLWGFPWVGTLGVLIYLAGLQSISHEIYEAAELDGIGFWGKIFRIEIPLILTQIRINLIFLTISTLGDYGFFLVLLGPTGGPDNAGMTPGLSMYHHAFVQNRFGYACALGLVMFAAVLFLTILYQRHLRTHR